MSAPNSHKRSTCTLLLLTILLLIVVTMMATFQGLTNDRQSYKKPIIRRSEDSSYTFDIFHCPPMPTPDYPQEFNVLHVLGNWSIDDVEHVTHPAHEHQGVCVFDYQRLGETIVRERIDSYRAAEVPFVVRNDPLVSQAVEKWSNITYMRQKLNGKQFEATLANSTHMEYFSLNEGIQIPPGFQPPTRFAPMSFDEWHRRAQHRGEDEEYAYLRVDACLDNDKDCDATYRTNPEIFSEANFIYDDLRFFHPMETTQYNIDSTKARGIQCRFGAPGLISENHFDNERNFIAMLRGQRRYLLSHPRNCPHMHLHPQNHPSERHSKVNWSQPDIHVYPEFANARVNQVVLRAGDVLYLPTFWFHHIVSLTTNYQCNTRSGYSVEYDQIIYDCGFFYDFPE